MKRDFIALSDYTSEELAQLLDLADSMKAQPERYTDSLRGRTLGMIFNKRSTRTRISFEVGMFQLGGLGLFFSPNDTQLARGETIADTARVLSRYLDAVMIRTFAHTEVLEFARHASIPVINGLTDFNHPCQAMADLMTLKERFGHLEGLKLAYLGDANNVAVSLLNACVKFGLHMAVVSPEGYTLPPEVIAAAQPEAEARGVSLQFTPHPEEGIKGADAVYTDTWTSMGQEAEHDRRVRDLAPYQVNEQMMALAKPQAVFMHCLPAHRGEEVTDAVMDGPASAVWDQAENRLHFQKALLYHLLG